jgi:hypothetical protein
MLGLETLRTGFGELKGLEIRHGSRFKTVRGRASTPTVPNTTA